MGIIESVLVDTERSTSNQEQEEQLFFLITSCIFVASLYGAWITVTLEHNIQ